MTTKTPPQPAKNGTEPEPTAPEEDVLDLTSLVPVRRLVKLPTKAHPDGERFELRLLDDFGIQKQQELLANSRKYETLFNSDNLRPSERDRLKHLLDTLFDEVLDAPVAAKREMPDGVRSRVVSAFSWAPLLAQQQAAQKEREKQILAILVDRELVSQEQLDEITAEIEKSTSGS